MISAINPPLMPVAPGHRRDASMANQPNKLPPIQAPSGQGPYHPPNPYESSSTATTISPRSPNDASGGLASAPRSGDARSYPQGPVPPPRETMPRYSGDYDPMMVSPPGYDQYRGTRLEMMGGSPHTAHSVQGHLQQKRAYRQRRKDPSCDACRERKVKCDATDTSSCSECSSRNVKCQFTKETNRRMSSIKQVQDLEKQLVTTKEQLSRYQSALKSKGMLDTEVVAIEDEDSMAGAASPSKRRKIRSSREGSALAKPDDRMTQLLRDMIHDTSAEAPRSEQLELSMEAASKAVSDFSASALSQPRFVDLQDVIRKIEGQSNERNQRSAVVSGCIACGALQSNMDSAEFHYQALQSAEAKEAGLDKVRVALLSVIYLSEVNRYEQAFMQLGVAVSASYAMGLQCSMETTQELDRERRELWTAVVCWERTLSLDRGRPSMIQDEDLGSAFDDGALPAPSRNQSGMQRVAKIARQAHAAFKQDMIPMPVLVRLDQALSLSPEDDQAPPHIPWANIYVLAARLLVHRHHVTPFVPDDVRHAGAETCAAIAAETLRALEAAEQHLGGSEDQDAFARAARAGPAGKLAVHLWRSALASLLAGDVRVARGCARLLAALEDARPAAKRYGRHLALFAEAWRARAPGGWDAVLADPEVVTLASGDAQGRHEQAWVRGVANAGEEEEGDSSDAAMANGVTPAGEGAPAWMGWQALLDALGQLPQMPVQDPPAAVSEEGQGQSASSASNRMKIADLMG